MRISPRVGPHEGQHPNCRACGTNPRVEGRNPRQRVEQLMQDLVKLLPSGMLLAELRRRRYDFG